MYKNIDVQYIHRHKEKHMGIKDDRWKQYEVRRIKQNNPKHSDPQ